MKNLKWILSLGILLFTTSVFAQECKRERNPEQMAQKKAEKMRIELSLNESQTTQLTTLFQEAHKKRNAIKNTTLDESQRKAEMKNIRKSMDNDLRKILSDDQYALYQQKLSEQRENRKLHKENTGEGKKHKHREVKNRE
jgi:methionine-rich copper-binding protein CopC